MQLVEEQPGLDDVPPVNTWYFRPACTRSVGAAEVTRAYPGRRYVELAQQFVSMSYVYSICNPDWSDAMMDIARLIAEQMAGTCYKKPLDWDPVGQVAKCNVVVEYENPEDATACPPEFDGAEPVIKMKTSDEGEDEPYMYCAIPKIAFPQDCGNETVNQEDFGWYYCENLTAENFDEACQDNIDNDGDGLTDCDDPGDPENPETDPGCGACADCGGVGQCLGTCKYVVQLTDTAQKQVTGLHVQVECLQQFSFEDQNCQEDTQTACNDNQDNDGNGIWDCSNEVEGAVEGEVAHNADPSCCPMEGGSGSACDLGADELYKVNCPESETVVYQGGYPDACLEAAQRLGCTLP